MIIANGQNISNLIGCEEYNISRIALFYKKKIRSISVARKNRNSLFKNKSIINY